VVSCWHGSTMARKQRHDKALDNELDNLESAMNRLKVVYDKYFMGIERFEPMKDRDAIRNTIRELIREKTVQSSAQRFRFQSLRARWTSLDNYLTRNLVMIERGTHPKMKFRANLAERRRGVPADVAAAAAAVRQDRAERHSREDQAMRKIYDRYVEARSKCGQNTNIGYDAVAETLKKQVRVIKGRYQCDSVKFRVTVEDGKAKLKAIPVR